MVHGRKINGQVDEFGVSGYVYKNVFLIYDRRTQSLWYPLDETGWTAVSGPRKGEIIPFIEEPGVVPLGQWRKQHSGTTVLLGSRREIEESHSEHESAPRDESSNARPG